MNASSALLVLGLGIAGGAPALHLYLMWPIPGSQAVFWPDLVHALHEWRGALVVGGVILAGIGLGLGRAHAPRTWRARFALVIAVLACAGFALGDRLADPARLFVPPDPLRVVVAHGSGLRADTLVLGVEIAGEARAYPIGPLAYHHWIEDELGSEKIAVSYCPLARTGRVFHSNGNGAPRMKLVGLMRHNSVYADYETGSLWQQATGRAIAGPRRGDQLPEIPTDQMTLEEWLAVHPASSVLLPDPASEDAYRRFGFDLWDERRPDPEALPGAQWIVTVRTPSGVTAVDWVPLEQAGAVRADAGDVPVVVWLRPDGISLRAFDLRFGEETLDLRASDDRETLVDRVSGTRFDSRGVGRGGVLSGVRLRPAAVSLELRHAYRSFASPLPRAFP